MSKGLVDGIWDAVEWGRGGLTPTGAVTLDVRPAFEEGVSCTQFWDVQVWGQSWISQDGGGDEAEFCHQRLRINTRQARQGLGWDLSISKCSTWRKGRSLKSPNLAGCITASAVEVGEGGRNYVDSSLE